MKKQIVLTAIVFSMMIALAWPVLGTGSGHGGGHDSSEGGHGAGQGGHMMESSGQEGHMQEGHMMDPSGQDGIHGSHSGMEIHTATVDGYELRYELIDMKARMEGMENMPEMAHSHHMMVYVRDREGNAVENATVGYLIQGPGGGVQKTMCMGMGGGYGADVTLEDAGAYTIKTKVVTGKKTLMDGFEYEVK